MACRQCTRPSPVRVAISRIEKAWLREASCTLASYPGRKGTRLVAPVREVRGRVMKMGGVP